MGLVPSMIRPNGHHCRLVHLARVTTSSPPAPDVTAFA